MARGSSVLIFMAILVQSAKKHLVTGLQLLAICQVPIERATAGNITFHGPQASWYILQASCSSYRSCYIQEASRSSYRLHGGLWD
jgi:hypothetical protein